MGKLHHICGLWYTYTGMGASCQLCTELRSVPFLLGGTWGKYGASCLHVTFCLTLRVPLDTFPRTSVLFPWPPHFPGVMTLYLTQLPASNQPLGASEPRNMIYMSRLGIWGEGTPFRTFEEFLHAIEKR